MSEEQKQATYDQVGECPVPEGSMLESYSRLFPRALFDCFTLRVETKKEKPTVDEFSKAFFSSNAFQSENLILSAIGAVYSRPILDLAQTDKDGNQKSYGKGFFQVASENNEEIVLDSGPFLTWLAVYATHTGMDYRIGSIVKKPNPMVRLLLYPHSWYSKVLLTSAVKKIYDSIPE